uniref:Uncharacterized protein n=1 Tax=Solanum tuberosum TaxID=4113 RepID=M1AL79_SOLTU
MLRPRASKTLDIGCDLAAKRAKQAAPAAPSSNHQRISGTRAATNATSSIGQQLPAAPDSNTSKQQLREQHLTTGEPLSSPLLLFQFSPPTAPTSASNDGATLANSYENKEIS